MLQVVRWAGFIGGIVLLGLILALRLGRGDNPPQYILMSHDAEGDSFSLDSYYAIGIEGGATVTPISIDPIGLSFAGWSPEGWLLYFTRIDQYTGTSLIQFDVMGNLQRQLSDSLFVIDQSQAELVYWTPNRRWLVYAQFDPTTQSVNLMRRRFDGSAPLNLTAGQVAGFAPLMYYSFAYSPDNVWLYFQGYVANSHVHLMRVRLDGGPIEDLTPDPNNDYFLVYVPSGEDWWVVREQQGAQQRYWKMSWDGQDRQSLGEVTSSQIVFLDWLPNHQQLVTYDTHTGVLTGRRISDWEVMWEQTQRYFWGTTPDQQWVLMFTPNRELARLRSTGPAATEEKVIIPPRQTGHIWGWAPDNEWLWYTDIVTDIGLYEIRRVNIEGQVEILAQVGILPHFTGWTPDGEWATFAGSASAVGTPLAYRIRADGKGLTPMLHATPNYPYLTAFGPELNFPWDGARLAMGGVALLALNLGLGWWRRKNR